MALILDNIHKVEWFWRGGTFTFPSIFSYPLWRWTGYFRFRLWTHKRRARALRSRINRVAIYQKRMIVLRAVVELDLEGAIGRRLATRDVLKKLLGDDDIFDRSEEVLGKMRLSRVLASLADSGDLAEADRTSEAGHPFAWGYICVRPQALATLHDYEQEERRHGEILKMQRGQLVLTALTILVLAANAYTTWKNFEFLRSTSDPMTDRAKEELEGR